jgi:hypothetical protein
MIYAFNFTCDRDLELSNLMVRTLYKHCPNVKELVVINTDHNEEYKGYGNGAGWPASMLKLNRLREFNPTDDDFVLSVDSDVVFTSPEVFKYLNTEYGTIGIKHRPEYQTSERGRWSHLSGALIFIRGDIAKKMAAISEDALNNIRFNKFKPFNITENEDVVLSYLAYYVGANQFDLGTVPGLSSGDFESTVFTKFLMTDINGANLLPGGRWASFYHLNYCPTQFLGEQVAGKWDIPGVLERKGIEL